MCKGVHVLISFNYLFFSRGGSFVGLDWGGRRDPGGRPPTCPGPTTDSCPLLPINCSALVSPGDQWGIGSFLGVFWGDIIVTGILHLGWFIHYDPYFLAFLFALFLMQLVTSISFTSQGGWFFFFFWPMILPTDTREKFKKGRSGSGFITIIILTSGFKSANRQWTSVGPVLSLNCFFSLLFWSLFDFHISCLLKRKNFMPLVLLRFHQWHLSNWELI